MESNMVRINKSKGIDENFLNDKAKRITDSDIGKVVEKADKISDKFKTGGPLGRFIDDAKLLIAIVKDYWNKKYTEIPWWALSSIAATLLYVFTPIDLIPDFIPVIGLVDDALVVAICLAMVEQELHKYKEWKLQHPH
jgi:uncharacterized membrane protein YkvA (DUF1232 family)